MRYDPTREAVFHPEAQPPLAMTGAWPPDAICAEFCRLAYRRFEDAQAARDAIAAAVAPVGYGDIGFFDDPRAARARDRLDAQGFAAIGPGGHAIVAFRGTQPDSFDDIVTDARFRPIAWRGAGRVHLGFWRALESILPQIETWLDARPVATLTIAGHSLGAAMATLLAGLRPGADLVTLGSPRVGNAGFAASMAGRAIRRYVDCTDLVATVPPPIYYKHVDGLRYIDAKGIVHAAAPGPVALLADQAGATLDYAPLMLDPRNCPLRQLADHAPINYLSALLGLRQAA